MDSPKTASQGEESVVYARWKAYGCTHERIGGPRALAHVYETRLKPTNTLDVGMRIRLIALPMGMLVAPDACIAQLDAYDPHILGRVVRIAAEPGEGWARITILNECRGNPVGTVELDIPHVPGVTLRRAWLEGPGDRLEWVQPTPRGHLGLLCGFGREGKGTRLCGGAGCGLELEMPRPRKGTGILTWKAPRQEANEGQEGTFALHYWMKYEGY